MRGTVRAMRRWLTPARAAVAIVLLVGLGITVRRFALGLGAVTNLDDDTPWGLWIGFDVIAGVALAAGGFTTAFLVHIAGDRTLRPLARPAILTALLGYGLVIVGLLYDLGLPWHVWHALFWVNPHSVMFEVAWCVMLYTAVLVLEFLPVVLERFRAPRARRVLDAVAIPLYVAGILLSTLHQSSLGSLYLIAPSRLHPLWYTPLLPFLFFLSALAVGAAMVIVEAFLSARLMRRSLDLPPLVRVGQYLAFFGLLHLAVRIQDLVYRRAWSWIDGSVETAFFAAEIALFAAPLGVLFHRRLRARPAWLVAAAAMTVAAVVLDRIDVTLVGMARASGTYLPSWQEVWISAFLLLCGGLAFGLAARWFPVFAAVALILAPAPARPDPGTLAPPREVVYRTWFHEGTTVTFDHARHAGALAVPCSRCHHAENCRLCHQPGEVRTPVGPSRIALHRACLSCHEQRPGMGDCAVCHRGAPADPSSGVTGQARPGREALFGPLEALADPAGDVHLVAGLPFQRDRAPDPPAEFLFLAQGEGGLSLVSFPHREHARDHALPCGSCHHMERCGRCHGATAGLVTVAGRRRALMDNCVACHERTGLATGCVACHTDPHRR